MMQSGREGADAPFSEMLIVDTFTRLIFAECDALDPAAERVVEALRAVEPGVGTDPLPALGEYLRDLGVAEMVRLVARVQSCLVDEVPPAALAGGGVTTDCETVVRR